MWLKVVYQPSPATTWVHSPTRIRRGGQTAAGKLRTSAPVAASRILGRPARKVVTFYNRRKDGGAVGSRRGRTRSFPVSVPGASPWPGRARKAACRPLASPGCQEAGNGGGAGTAAQDEGRHPDHRRGRPSCARRSRTPVRVRAAQWRPAWATSPRPPRARDRPLLRRGRDPEGPSAPGVRTDGPGCRARRSANAVRLQFQCAGVQPRQLPAHPGVAEGGRAMGR